MGSTAFRLLVLLGEGLGGGEEVAFGGWGGVGELEDVYPLPEALQQEPGTQMYKAARLVCSSMRDR